MSVLSVYWWLKTGSCWFLHQKCVTTKGKSVNKVCIWILNYHLVNKFKTEAFWFVFKSIWYKIFTNCPKNFFGGVGGGRETEKNPNPFQAHTIWNLPTTIQWQNLLISSDSFVSIFFSMFYLGLNRMKGPGVTSNTGKTKQCTGLLVTSLSFTRQSFHFLAIAH